MHRLKRFFLIFIAVFLIFGSLLTASAEDLPVMSPSIGVGADPYDTQASSVGSVRFLLFSDNSNVFFSHNLVPAFPVTPISGLYSTNYLDSIDSDSNNWINGNLEFFDFSSSLTRDSFVPALIDGFASCNYSFYVFVEPSCDSMVVQFNDIYCWSHTDLYSVDSELVISSSLLSYFDSAVITYSSAGDTTVNQVTLEELPSSWSSSDSILLSPDLWNGSDDLYYIYDAKVYLDLGSSQSNVHSTGTIVNCFRSDLRQQDIMAALPSPPDIDPGDSVGTVLGLLSSVGDWFVDYIPDLVGLFWLDNSLTLFGVISVLGFGLFVVLLLAAFVSSLFKYR